MRVERKHGAVVENGGRGVGGPRGGWPPGSLQGLRAAPLVAWTEIVKQRPLPFPVGWELSGKLAQGHLPLWHGHHFMAAVLVHRVKDSQAQP